MRPLLVLLTILSGPVLAGNEPAVPEHVRKMLRTVDGATTLQVSIRSEVKGEIVWKTRAMVAGDNRVRLEMEVKTGSPAATQKIEFVSDGNTLQTTQNGRPPQVSTAHSRLSDRLQKAISRCGFLYSYLTPISRNGQDNQSTSDLLKMSDCRLQREENSDGQRLLVYTYTCQLTSIDQTSTGTVWINAATHLPVRRQFALGERQVTETYSNWAINKPVDKQHFAVSTDP